MNRRRDLPSRVKALVLSNLVGPQTRSCNKTVFPSKKIAEGRGRQLGMSAYRCPVCRHYHLTKQPR